MTTLNVTESAPLTTQVRLPVVTKEGHKTSVSIPRTLLTTLVTQFGSRKVFRKHLNAAVKAVEPVPGYSRSQRVRMHLERQLASGLRG